MSLKKTLILFMILTLGLIGSLSAQVRYIDIQGTQSFYNCGPVEPGAIIEAYNQYDVKLAQTIVINGGRYSIRIFEADTINQIFGVQEGELISLVIDGNEVMPYGAYEYPIVYANETGADVIDFEFMAQDPDVVTKSIYFMTFSSSATYLNGGLVPVGAIVEAFILETGKQIGIDTVKVNGRYNMSAYADADITDFCVEGAQAGDSIVFTINGAMAKVVAGNATFTSAMDVQTVDLCANDGVIGSAQSCSFYGAVSVNGVNATAGTIVTAYDTDGIVCGQFTLTQNGHYSMLVFGDDAATDDVCMDEGALEGEEVVFFVDDEPATQSPANVTWVRNGMLEVNLTVGQAQSNSWCDFIGINCKFNGAPLAQGMTVAAYNALDDQMCGTATVGALGAFTIRVVGKSETPVVEGPEENDPIYFMINNERAAVKSPYNDTLFSNWGSKYVTLESRVVPVVEDQKINKSLELKQNYPNPFNGTTVISFNLPSAQKVSLKVYNMLGEEICVLANRTMSAGSHEIVWDGQDRNGRSVPSSIYYYQLLTGQEKLVKRMVYMK